MGARCCADRKPRPDGWKPRSVADELSSRVNVAWAEGVSQDELINVFVENKQRGIKPLGLGLDENLFVQTVSPDGVLARHCKRSTEDDTICPGDQLYSVNEYTNKDAILEQIAGEEQLDMIFKVYLFFEAKLVKSAGLKFGATTDPRTFALLKIQEDSLIGRWNRDNPRKKIHVGDTILSINGITDHAAAVSEIASKDELLLELKRGPRKEVTTAEAGTNGKVFSAQQLKELRKKYDKNDDGSLSLEEFSTLSAALRKQAGKPAVSSDILRAIFKEFDLNNSGRMSFEELDHAASLIQKRLQNVLTPAQLAQLREKYDKNDDDKLNLQEFKGLANEMRKITGKPPVGDADLQAIFKEVDRNNSGTISFAELDQAGALLQMRVAKAKLAAAKPKSKAK